MNQKIRDIYNSLYMYFGLRQRDAYHTQVSGSADTTANGANKDDVERRISDVYHMLHGDEEFLPTISEICQKISDIEQHSSYDKFLVTPFKDDIYKIWRLSNEQGLGSVPFNETALSSQGVNFNKGTKVYTIGEMSKRFDPDFSRLDVLQVWQCKGTPELADTDVLTLFMSTINSVNMSLAVPYVEVSVSTSGLRGTPISNEPFSFGKFLNAPSSDSVSNAAFVSTNAIGQIPPQLLAAKLSQGGGVKFALDNDTPKDTNAIERTVASMEIFTSPQTLVNLEGGTKYNENTMSGKPIDKFRPFMNIENLELHVVPANAGLISFKTASMKLRLFDRGRLNDIAPIVAPTHFGVVKFEIEYGWSHPAGKSRGRKSDANSDRIGELIDSMKVKEVYQVINSNFSFEPDGSVVIDVKLSMLGAKQFVSSTIMDSPDTIEIAEIEKLLIDVRKLLIAAPKNINVPSVLMGGVDGLLSVSEKDKKELKAFVSSLGGPNSSLASAGRIASRLLISNGSKKSITETLQENRASQAKKIIDDLLSGPDPFLRTQGLPLNGQIGVSGEKLRKGYYVSLGKVLCNVIGPVFQDVADTLFIFTCFNKDAAAMYDHNVSQFPIKVKSTGTRKNEMTLETQLKKLLQTHSKVTPEIFLQMLNEDFINRPGYDAYALGDVYATLTTSDKDDQKGDALVDDLNKNSDSASNQMKKEVRITEALKRIYEGRSSPSFTQPKISMKIDTKSCAPNPKFSQSQKVIHRVTFFDEAASNVADIQQVFDDITAEGFFEKVDYTSPGNGTNSAKHGVVSNEIFKELVALRLIGTYELLKNNKIADVSGGATFDTAKALLEKLEDVANEDKPPERIKLESNQTRRNELIEKLRNIYFFNNRDDNPRKLRDIFYKYYPTIIFGSMGSGILSAQLSSNQNDALNTIMQQKQPDPFPTLPMLIHPTQLTLDVVGCPLFKYSQKFFIDFGTGTSADNFYVVTGVDMNFSPGEFKTSLKMTQLDTYGRFMKSSDTILKTMISAYKHEEEKTK